MADFKPNMKWFDKASRVKVQVPAHATHKQKRDALAKEMKRQGLTK